MAHFITLLFLSLGLNFGNAEVSFTNETIDQRNLKLNSTNTYTISKGKTVAKTKLFSHNKNIVKIQSVGTLGWKGDK